MSNLALLFIDDATSFKTGDTNKDGILVKRPASSLTSFFKSVNGESQMIPAKLGSLSACSRAVTAPIDRPQSAMLETFLSSLRCLTIIATSSRSYHPSDMYSPSDFPQPAKSKQRSEIFYGRRWEIHSVASTRQLELPCM